MNLDVRDKTIVWVVYRRESENIYHFQGIACASGNYSAEEIAVSMCRDEHYFIFPIILNTVLPHDRVDAVGLYFPLKQDESTT